MKRSSPEGPAGAPPLLQRLTVRHLFVLVPVAAVAWRAGGELSDNSFLWHVRAGTIQLEAGEVLRHDPFSFTFGGNEWRTQSWLIELLYGAAENAFGSLSWAPYLTFALLAGTLGFVGLAAYRIVRTPGRTAVVVTAAAWVGMTFTVPRPVAASFLLLAVFAVILGHPERLAWALIPLTWLWASVHGLFTLGIALVAAEALRRRSWRLGGIAVVSGGVSLATAHGKGIVDILAKFVDNRDALRFLSEWERPDFFSPGLLPVMAIGIGLLIAFARRRLQAGHLLIVIPLGLLAVVQLRSVFPAVIVLAPLAGAALVAEPGEASTNRSPAGGLLNVAIAGVLALAALGGLLRPVTRDTRVLPSAEAVAALGSERAFHGPGAGGLLIYTEYPHLPVFVDDRAELYGVDFFGEVADAMAGRTGTEIMDRYDLGVALVRTEWPLDEVLRDAGWVERHRDDRWAVFERPD